MSKAQGKFDFSVHKPFNFKKMYLMMVCFLSFRLLNIEYEMTNFAYYYVGIGGGVFILGYLQVRLFN